MVIVQNESNELMELFKQIPSQTWNTFKNIHEIVWMNCDRTWQKWTGAASHTQWWTNVRYLLSVCMLKCVSLTIYGPIDVATNAELHKYLSFPSQWIKLIIKEIRCGLDKVKCITDLLQFAWFRITMSRNALKPTFMSLFILLMLKWQYARSCHQHVHTIYKSQHMKNNI